VESIDLWRNRFLAMASALRIATILKEGKTCVESDAWTAIPAADRFGQIFSKPWTQSLRGQRGRHDGGSRSPIS